MKFRTTLVLLALVIGLMAFLIFHTLRRPGRAEYEENLNLVFPAAEAGAKLSQQAVGMELIWKNKTIAVSRSSSPAADWRMTQPFPALADSETIASIISALEALRPLRALGRQQGTDSLRAYGLGKPDGSVTLVTSGSGRLTLEIGALTADGNSVYAMRADASSPDVLVLPSAILELARIEPGDLREMRLLRFDPAKTDRITLRVAGKPEAVELTRSARGWEMAGSRCDLAEEAEINKLMSILSARSLRGANFISDDSVRLSGQRSVIDVFEGKQSSSLRVDMGTDEQWYCSRNGDTGLISISNDLTETLRGIPDSLRARRALPFAVDEASALAISGPAAIVLECKGTQWSSAASAEPADADRIRFFLRRLSDLEVRERIDSPAPEQLAQSGLETPRWTIRVETPRTTWELRIGSPAPGGALVYVRRGDSGPILKVPDTIVDALAPGWQAFAARIVALDLRKEKLSSIRVESQGRSALIVRDGKNWMLKEPVGTLNQDAVAALLLNVSLIEASQALPLPQRLSEYGLDRPRASVVVSVEAAPPARRTLLIGNPAPGGGVYAMNGELDRVFIIEDSILKTIQRQFPGQ